VFLLFLSFANSHRIPTPSYSKSPATIGNKPRFSGFVTKTFTSTPLISHTVSSSSHVSCKYTTSNRPQKTSSLSSYKRISGQTLCASASPLSTHSIWSKSANSLNSRVSWKKTCGISTSSRTQYAKPTATATLSAKNSTTAVSRTRLAVDSRVWKNSYTAKCQS